uniref:Uncharacterized protein n=1 Tax=Rhizophora mucronata TaxID=61149 RepID=A0A2P2QEV0_RHIMU
MFLRNLANFDFFFLGLVSGV